MKSMVMILLNEISFQETVEFEAVASHSSSQHSVQNFVSSSVDLVHSHQLDHGMHCTVDSTVGPKLQGDEVNCFRIFYHQKLFELWLYTGLLCHLENLKL